MRYLRQKFGSQRPLSCSVIRLAAPVCFPTGWRLRKALARGPDRLPARCLCTTIQAVLMPAVAARAQDHLDAAAQAQEESAALVDRRGLPPGALHEVGRARSSHRGVADRRATTHGAFERYSRRPHLFPGRRPRAYRTLRNRSHRSERLTNQTRLCPDPLGFRPFRPLSTPGHVRSRRRACAAIPGTEPKLRAARGA